MGKIIRTSQNNIRKAIDAAIDDASEMVAKVGYFPSAKYTDGTSIAYVASIHEYGVPSKNIPPRPFFRPTADRRMNVWKQVYASKVKDFMRGNGFAKDAFEAVGNLARGEIDQAISDVHDPVLAKATIAARARRAHMKIEDVSIKPLVDTGAMKAHLTQIVEKK